MIDDSTHFLGNRYYHHMHIYHIYRSQFNNFLGNSVWRKLLNDGEGLPFLIDQTTSSHIAATITITTTTTTTFLNYYNHHHHNTDLDNHLGIKANQLAH